MSESIIKIKSFNFAVRVANLNKTLQSRNEYVISKQLLRSGTSIGANIREALNAESTKDFIHKLSISQKEADETMYWLELLFETEYLSEKEFKSIHSNCNELLKILRSIIITTKKNNSKK